MGRGRVETHHAVVGAVGIHVKSSLDVGRGCSQTTGQLGASAYALMKAINGCVPKMLSARFRL